MLHAQKAALANNVRVRMVAIRERELDYYTNCARNLSNQVRICCAPRMVSSRVLTSRCWGAPALRRQRSSRAWRTAAFDTITC